VPVFSKPDRTVLFVHIPKAAGSTLEQMFVRSGWRVALRETQKTHPRLRPLRRCSPQHYHAALLQELLRVDRFDAIFTVTREPVSRFRSEYVMRQGRNPRIDSVAVEEWADRVLARREDNPYALDNHLRPQHEFVLPGSLVYRLEDGLESAVADLNERFDLGVTTAVPPAMEGFKRAGVRSSEVEVSDRLHTTLRSVYADDFARFGYA
jgi:hypothetical protein